MKAIGNQVTWVLNLRPVKSQMIWQPDHLNLKPTDWISNQLKFKTVDVDFRTGWIPHLPLIGSLSLEISTAVSCDRYVREREAVKALILRCFSCCFYHLSIYPRQEPEAAGDIWFHCWSPEYTNVPMLRWCHRARSPPRQGQQLCSSQPVRWLQERLRLRRRTEQEWGICPFGMTMDDTKLWRYCVLETSISMI